jgi:hypothetical protein
MTRHLRLIASTDDDAASADFDSPSVYVDFAAENDQFDLEAIRYLARHDPERLEAVRQKAVEAPIRRSPNEERMLRGLQFRIDMTRRRSRTALKACLMISGMMWDSVGRLNAVMQALAYGDSTKDIFSVSTSSTSQSRVVPFDKAAYRQRLNCSRDSLNSCT